MSIEKKCEVINYIAKKGAKIPLFRSTFTYGKHGNSLTGLCSYSNYEDVINLFKTALPFI